MHRSTRIPVLALVALLVGALPSLAQGGQTWQIVVTNLSPQIISPPIVVTHGWQTFLFRGGAPASPEIAAVAEDAVADPLLAALAADPHVHDFAIAGGPLLPGHRVVLEVDATAGMDRLSALGMLVTTNDAFFGLDNHRLDADGPVERLLVSAFDAGTEANNELCAFIPGPPCGNPLVRDEDGAEGFVGVHPGIHGIGDLEPSEWDWRNPVVSLTVIPPRF